MTATMMTNEFFRNDRIRPLIAEIAEVARYFWEKGWAERNAGNISVNITELLTGPVHYFDDCLLNPLNTEVPQLSGNIFLVTATGVRMRDLAAEPEKGLCLIQIDEDGKSFKMAGTGSGVRKGSLPTSELPTHLAIQQMLREFTPSTKVVMHAHVPEFIALSQIKEFKSAVMMNRLLFGMHPETKMFVPRGIGFIPYTLPGTDAIAVATVKELKNHPVVVWEKHGLFATGETVLDVFDTMDILTKSAKIFLMCKSAGYDPEGLTDEQIGEIPEFS
jgi:rhamnulose-1-phosphate aldolase